MPNWNRNAESWNSSWSKYKAIPCENPGQVTQHSWSVIRMNKIFKLIDQLLINTNTWKTLKSQTSFQVFYNNCQGSERQRATCGNNDDNVM